MKLLLPILVFTQILIKSSILDLAEYETTDDEVMTGITRTITPNETDRLSRVERLLIQLIARQDAQDETIKTLKVIKPTPKMVSSTPFRVKKSKTSVEDEMRKVNFNLKMPLSHLPHPTKGVCF